MGKLALEISARLENVKSIETCGPDFRYYIKTKCTNCGDESDKWQYVTLCETHEGRTGRSDVHMKSKCKGCSRELSLVILEDSIKPYVYDEEKDEVFLPIVAFDCRGLEVTDFDFRGGWIVRALNSTTYFEAVDLGEGDWADYDEKADESVAIYETKCRFVKAK